MKINILLGRGSFSTAQSIDETYKFRRHRKWGVAKLRMQECF
jgi:hypothetical protein